MPYTVKKGDTLWEIARVQLGDARRWQEIADRNRLKEPYLLYVGQGLQLPPRQAGFAKRRLPITAAASPPVLANATPTADLSPAISEFKKVLAEIDNNEELRGSGLVLQFPSGQTYQLRESNHASGLETIVVARIETAEPADERSWWERWNGVVLNCGGAAISWGGVVLTAAAEVPSVGAATPLFVVAVTSATATTAQCGLAIAKETNEDFERYLQTEDGNWVNQADVVLDVASLAGGVTGAIAALKSGGQLMKTSRYAKYLDAERKGKLLKTLQRIEKQEQDLQYFRQALERLKSSGKVLDPANRGVSNNLLNRAMPFVTRSLRQETLGHLATMISAAAATTSSYYGGSGSQNLGLVKVTISVLQERIDKAK